MSPAHPRLIFGGSTIGAGEWATVESVGRLLEKLRAHDINEIDGAGLYPVTNMGACESLLGEAGAADLGFKIDTKILVTSQATNGTLEPSKINSSITASRDRLKLHEGGPKLSIVHCHGPDYATPIEEQAAALDALHKRGVFEQLGLCNFPLDLLTKLIEACEKNGYVKPTVYQGMYNAVARKHESLFPFLREHGITFTAHSPLASGFLSGKLTAGDVQGTRFGQDNMIGQFLKQQYDKKELHDAIRSLKEIIDPTQISLIEATLRWISYHSQLRPEDAIILGATQPHQISDNVKFIEKGPLPETVVDAIDKIWEAVSNIQIFYG